METVAIMEVLLELSRELEIDVRVLSQRGVGDGEIAPTSAVCRVRGKTCVMLWPDDPLESQSRVLAQALVSEAKTSLETRYLPPAVRAILDAAGGPDGQA